MRDLFTVVVCFPYWLIFQLIKYPCCLGEPSVIIAILADFLVSVTNPHGEGLNIINKSSTFMKAKRIGKHFI